jgi:hypothetical protein
MPSPAESNDKLRPPPRWLRWVRWFTWKRVRRILIVSTVLLAAGYWIENVRGRRAFQSVLDSYAVAGVDLDPRSYLAAEPPPEENFGATPLLDGIAVEDGAGHPGEALAIQKRRRLAIRRLQTGESNSVVGLSYRDIYGPPRKRPGGRWSAQRPEGVPVPAPRAIDWYHCCVEFGHKKGAANLPSHVQFVYDALNSELALFDELVAASTRKWAVFTPAPQSLPKAQDRRPGTEELYNLLRVRASAAATLRKTGEAAALTRVIWRIREAHMAEPGGMWSNLIVVNQWIACAEDVVRSRAATDADLVQLLEFPVHHWQPEEEWRRSLYARSANVASSWQEIVEEAGWSVTGDLQGAFRVRFNNNTRAALLVPRGWLAQNGAAYLRSLLTHRVLPLRNGGLAALPAADAAWDEAWFSADRPWWWWHHPYRYFLPSWSGAEEFSLLLPTHAICRIRLTILALGMERYRLAHGRYPEDPAALVPQFLPALPPDMDHAPLRCVIRPDGSGAVLYSIGWNLTDDWHGVIPGGKGEPHYSEADWTLTLPLPPLNPP